MARTITNEQKLLVKLTTLILLATSVLVKLVRISSKFQMTICKSVIQSKGKPSGRKSARNGSSPAGVPLLTYPETNKFTKGALLLT